ncbi:MAG TPA: type VI secretion system accessory protein TagJ [Opitutaceae bacterium]
MTSTELLHAGRLDDALATLQAEIRTRPEDPKLRVFLFQLNCVLGRWEKALNQLQALASLNADTMLLAQIFRPLIACELLRREVFCGKRTPLIFGEPMEWVGWLVRANALVAEENYVAAAELRARAFDAAPATPGKLNDAEFAWLADADSRLGPILEAMIDGKYYWIPFCRIRKIITEAPSDLRDLVWLPASFTWANEGNAIGHLPVRYAATEAGSDDALRLARKTAWAEKPEDTFIGAGQRLLTTDAGEYPLLECRTMDLEPEVASP